MKKWHREMDSFTYPNSAELTLEEQLAQVVALAHAAEGPVRITVERWTAEP
jgi:hypothetical protein